jgi:hypothetical protein
VLLWLVIVWKLIRIGIHVFCLLNFNDFLEHEQKSDLFLSVFTMVFKDNHKNVCWNIILDLQTWIGVNKNIMEHTLLHSRSKRPNCWMINLCRGMTSTMKHTSQELSLAPQ